MSDTVRILCSVYIPDCTSQNLLKLGLKNIKLIIQESSKYMTRKSFEKYYLIAYLVVALALILFLKPANEDLFNIIFMLLIGFGAGMALGLTLKFKGEK